MSREWLSCVTQADQTALLRETMEGIIFRQGLPSCEWDRMYQETLRGYPNLMCYRSIFDRVLKDVRAANEQLEEVWRRNIQAEDTGENSQTAGKKVAGPKTSGRLYQAAFAFVPLGKVTAVNETIALRLMVDDEDYRMGHFMSEHEEIVDDASTHYPHQFRFPVLLVRKSSSPMEEHMSILHELEHAKNSLLANGRRHFLNRLWWFNQPPQIQRLKDLEFYNRDQLQAMGKNELLAYSTWMEAVNYSPSISDHARIQEFKECSQIIMVALTDPNAVYYKNDSNQSSPDQKKRYLDNVEKGTSALTELFSHYLEISFGNRALRLTINVLELFPLQYWPAVVRFIRKQHVVDKTGLEPVTCRV